MFIAVLFTIAKKKKQRKCPSTNEWINKIFYIHIIKYYSTTKTSADTCYEIDEPQKYAKWREPDTKRLHMVWFHLYEIMKKREIKR